MRPFITALAIGCLAPSLAIAEPTQTASTTSYRHQTLLVDGISLGFMLGGSYLNDGPGDRGDTLIGIGLLGSVLGTPFVHGLRGHSDRFMGSLGIRLGLMTAGTVAAVMAAGDCDDPNNDHGTIIDPDFLCEMEYIGYGIMGAAVAATVIDAALFTDEVSETPRWTPHLAPTRDGVRAGVTWAF